MSWELVALVALVLTFSYKMEKLRHPRRDPLYLPPEFPIGPPGVTMVPFVEIRPVHPYGTTPQGLEDEVRVEMEKAMRENNLAFPSCAERCGLARQVARSRWPEYFVGEFEDNHYLPPIIDQELY